MKIDTANITPILRDFEVVGANLYAEVRDDRGNQVTAGLMLSAEEFQSLKTSGLSDKDVARAKIAELLELEAKDDSEAVIASLTATIEMLKSQIQVQDTNISVMQKTIAELTMMLAGGMSDGTL